MDGAYGVRPGCVARLCDLRSCGCPGAGRVLRVIVALFVATLALPATSLASGGWLSRSLVDQQATARSVSCVSASFCVTANSQGGVMPVTAASRHRRHRQRRNAARPRPGVRQPAPCYAAFPEARRKTIGRTTWYNRQESVRMVVCYGFGLGPGADFPVSASMTCGLVAQAIGGKGQVAAMLSLFVDGACSGADLASDPSEPAKYIGIACGWASDLLGVLIKPAGVIASLGCTLAPSAGHALGSIFESKHELDVAIDVIQYGKCIKYSPTHFGSPWLAVKCARNDPGFSDLPLAPITTGGGASGSGSGSSEGSQPPSPGPLPGAGWTLQSLPGISATKSGLSGVSCVSGSWCLAVGGSEKETLTEIWNGSSWTHQATTNIGEPGGVSCLSTTWCMAVGTSAAKWNGSDWESVPLPTVGGSESTPFFSDSCTSPSFCIAAGQANFSGGEFTPITAKWNGTNWSLLTTPSPAGSLDTDLVSVSCPAENRCTAVGGYNNDEGIFTGEAYAEHWDGAGWTIQTTPNPGSGVYSGLNSVSCPNTGSCVAVGYWGKGLGYSPVPLAEEWNGSSWSSTGAVLPGGATEGETAYVSCASSTSACEAVGQFYASASGEGSLAEGWNGSSWTVQSTPNPSGAVNSYFDGISCSSSVACVADGSAFPPEGGIAFAESYSG